MCIRDSFARVLFGWLPGGLGVVTVVSCTLFGGVSGSAIADTAAIGSLVIPAMVARGYSRGFAAALLAVAGTLALLMPLSIPFLIYAFISGVSMRTLSMAGLVPALATAIALIAVCMWHGKRTGCDNGEGRSTGKEIWAATRDAGPALLMPLIIIGGIWSGVFTPSESAAVAVVYGLLVSLYYLSLIHISFRYLLGEVEAVSARLRRLNPAIAGEDCAHIVFEFGDGCTGLFDGNRLNDHVADNPLLTMGEMWLEGERGVLRLDGQACLWFKPHGGIEVQHPYGCLLYTSRCV